MPPLHRDIFRFITWLLLYVYCTSYRYRVFIGSHPGIARPRPRIKVFSIAYYRVIFSIAGYRVNLGFLTPRYCFYSISRRRRVIFGPGSKFSQVEYFLPRRRPLHAYSTVTTPSSFTCQYRHDKVEYPVRRVYHWPYVHPGSTCPYYLTHSYTTALCP